MSRLTIRPTVYLRSFIVTFVMCVAMTFNCPAAQEKLLFIHHSCGENWLADGLRDALQGKGIEVHDATYGDAIGEDTDVCHWYPKFKGQLEQIFTFDAHPDTYYQDASQNDIIMFKSCFPNSDITDEGNIETATAEDCEKTMASYKASYNALVDIFAAHPDKLFIIVTAPPLLARETSPAAAGRARQFNAWLTTEYLSNYREKSRLHNVVVFDFFSVLADDKGFLRKDLASNPGDSHPSAGANKKATELFLPFLDSAIAQWKAKK
ncbi:MAG: SGNH/GDSL hydrolase family protein [Candidatus Omnitrophota bacterium]|nr:SGNH/GDSL hydrolase family protein [Candidatus Omnitrophota bacterium]